MDLLLFRLAVFSKVIFSMLHKEKKKQTFSLLKKKKSEK